MKKTTLVLMLAMTAGCSEKTAEVRIVNHDTRPLQFRVDAVASDGERNTPVFEGDTVKRGGDIVSKFVAPSDEYYLMLSAGNHSWALGPIKAGEPLRNYTIEYDWNSYKHDYEAVLVRPWSESNG